MCNNDSEFLRDLLRRWRSGDQTAAHEIYYRYEPKLLGFIERNLGLYLRPLVDVDDIANMAGKSLLRIAADKSGVLDHNGSLSGLAVTIALKKILKTVETYTTQKRDIQKQQVLEPALLSREPTPEEIVELCDLLEELRKRIRPDDYAVVAVKLDAPDLSNRELARELGSCHTTIGRKQRKIVATLRSLLGQE